MAALIFDTHKAVKSLEEAGFEESQAEAVVDMISGAVGENLATKSDLHTVQLIFQSELKSLEQTFQSELKSLEQTFQSDLKSLEQTFQSDLKSLEQTFQSDLKSLEQRMTIKLGALVFAGFGVMIAFLKLLP